MAYRSDHPECALNQRSKLSSVKRDGRLREDRNARTVVQREFLSGVFDDLFL
jgi:hypothetical protein